MRGAVRRGRLNPMVRPSTVWFKAQTSPPKWTTRPRGSWESNVQVVSLDARYRPCEVGPSRQIHSDPGTDMKRATDKLALRSSWARRSRCVGVRLTRLATRQDTALSYGFRCPVSDQVELNRPHRAPPRRVLSPLPLLFIKLCGCRWIKEPVFIPLTHSSSRHRPAGARSVRAANHNATRLGIKFDFLGELGLL